MYFCIIMYYCKSELVLWESIQKLNVIVHAFWQTPLIYIAEIPRILFAFYSNTPLATNKLK